MRYLCVLFLIVAASPMLCNGQSNENSSNGTLKTKSAQLDDSARLAIEAKSKRVWRRSLILPGWGQHTNGGLWWLKVPIIYGGFVTGVLVFNFNQGYYKDYLAEAQYRIQNNNAPPPWSPYQRGDEDFTNSVINAKDYHRRNRDLTVLVMVGWWGLNAVEAYVSEMLKNRWSVSDALMARVDPAIIPMPGPNGHSSAIGLKIQFGFK